MQDLGPIEDAQGIASFLLCFTLMTCLIKLINTQTNINTILVKSFFISLCFSGIRLILTSERFKYRNPWDETRNFIDRGNWEIEYYPALGITMIVVGIFCYFELINRFKNK
jgi:hypothetical protein